MVSHESHGRILLTDATDDVDIALSTAVVYRFKEICIILFTRIIHTKRDCRRLSGDVLKSKVLCRPMAPFELFEFGRVTYPH